MDMKLKCIFEFTEEEQQKLQHLKPSSDAPTNNISQQSVTLTNAGGQKSTSSTSSKPTSKPAAADVYSAADAHANDFESMTSLNTNTSSNITATTTTANARSTAAAAATAAAVKATPSGQQDSKNENTLNELKFFKQENEALKKEVNRLKVSRPQPDLDHWSLGRLIIPTLLSFQGRRTAPTKAGAASARASQLGQRRSVVSFGLT